MRQLVWPSGLLPFSILCITAAAHSKLPCNLIKATCLTYLQNGNMLIAVFIFSKLVRSFFPRGHLSLSYRRAIRSFSLSPIKKWQKKKKEMTGSQWASVQNIRTLKLKQLNAIRSLLFYFRQLCFSCHEMLSFVEKTGLTDSCHGQRQNFWTSATKQTRRYKPAKSFSRRWKKVIAACLFIFHS